MKFGRDKEKYVFCLSKCAEVTAKVQFLSNGVLNVGKSATFPIASDIRGFYTLIGTGATKHSLCLNYSLLVKHLGLNNQNN